MKALLIMICVVLSSCSYTTKKQVDYNKSHREFLSLVEAKKKSLSKSDYRNFLQTALQNKEDVEDNLEGQMDNLKRRTTHNEVMETSSNQEAHLFNANTGAIEMKRLDDRIKLVKREIFFLRSQLSSLEEKK
ncbi:MAG: hypothetical protein EP319_05640 [Deltaproteobacteria bacterium]|nr:MAG: hypothetical protein EP319_05640 [Deltaproteobacteria bacterium]